MAPKIKGFFKDALIGGLVFLPAIIVPFLFWWFYDSISTAINPLTVMVVKRSGMPMFLANALVIIFLLLLFFFTGAFIKTRPGRVVQEWYEEMIKKIIPFYSVFRGVIGNIFDQKKGKHIFSTPVKVRIYAEGTQFFAFNGFLVDESEMENDGTVFPENKLVTVFIPASPPTSGFCVDVPRAWVIRIDAMPDEAIRVVLSCGNGSLALWGKK